MIRARWRRGSWVVAIVAAAGLSVTLAWAVLESAPGTLFRDIALVTLSATFALSVSLMLASIAWERSERDRFYQSMYAYATEQAGNVIRLQLNRQYSGSANVSGQNLPFIVPIYSLAYVALNGAIQCDLVSAKKMGSLQVLYLQVEEFNRMTELAGSWFGSTIASPNPTSAAVNGLTTLSTEIENKRQYLLVEMKHDLSDEEHKESENE